MQIKSKLLLFLMALFLIVQFVFSLSGGGTEADPYVITTCVELDHIQSSSLKFYVLGNDIDCSMTSYSGGALWNNGRGFNPISRFIGTLDGANHSITSLFINKTNFNFIGLFGQTDGATIKNLTLDVNIFGQEYVGAVSGSSENTTFENVIIRGNINGKLKYVGGVVGYAKSSSFVNINNFSKIDGNSYTGGISGRVTFSSMRNISNLGEVNGRSVVGGLIGGLSNSLNLVALHNSGKITGFLEVGGIVGIVGNDSLITHAYNTGGINCPNYAGGIIGYNNYAYGNDIPVLVNSYNTGTINGSINAGGIAGRVNSVVKNSFSVGKVYGEFNVQGLFGFSPNIMVNNYWYDADLTDNATTCGSCYKVNSPSQFFAPALSVYVFTYFNSNPGAGSNAGNGWIIFNYWNDGTWVWDRVSYPKFCWQVNAPCVPFVPHCIGTITNADFNEAWETQGLIDDKQSYVSVTPSNYNLCEWTCKRGFYVAVLDGGNQCWSDVNAVCGTSLNTCLVSFSISDTGTSDDNSTHYFWTCIGKGSTSVNTQCSLLKPINGSCSTTRVKSFLFTDNAWPSESTYCSSGTVSLPAPNFPSAGSSVSWVCNSSTGGSPSPTCTASRASAPMNGECNNLVAKEYNFLENFPSSGFCLSGVADPLIPLSPLAGASTTWHCDSINGGNPSSNCIATRSTFVNGVCNSSVNNGCVSGILNNVDDNLTHYKWDCNGAGVGGTSISCNLLIPVNGVCGNVNGGLFYFVPTNNLCSVGEASIISGSGPWTWSCSAIGTGTIALCSANRNTNFFCLGNMDLNSELYVDDDKALDSNLQSVLVNSDSVAKCEYHCKNHYYKGSGVDENKCFPSSYFCLGEMDSNSIMYANDNIGFDYNVQSSLVDSNTNKKCEYYCRSGFYKGSGVDENKCIPYVCNGTIYSNAEIYVGDNIGLDRNYLNSLVDSDSNNKKCEWHCKNNYQRGVGYNANVCLPVLIRTCDGNIDPNAQLFVGDDENISLVDNRTNILVVENSELKCEWHCKSGYYLEDSSSGYVCVPEVVEEFNCSGAIDGNAVIFSNDNRGLVVDLNNVLVDFNTGRKCEWYCKGGFYLGSVSGVGVCLPNRYSCKNSVSGGVIYLGDDSGLTSDLNSVLVEANSSRKCEYHCGRYYVKVGDACVLSVVSNAVCGNAEKSYTVEESFFGSYSLCSVGVSSLSNPVLGSEVGSIVEWVCVSDVNVSCSASRVSSKYVPPVENNDVLNSIEVLTSQMLDDGNLEVTMKCLKTTAVDLNIVDYLSNESYSFNQKQFDCTTSEVKYKIKLNPAPEVERSLIIRASMNGDKTECSTCKLDYFVEYVPTNSLIESDPNVTIFLGILVLVILIAVSVAGLTLIKKKR